MEVIIYVVAAISLLSSLTAISITYIKHEKTKRELEKAKSFGSRLKVRSAVLDSLEEIENAVVQVGNLIVIKTIIDGDQKIAVIELMEDQKRYLSENESLLKDPQKLYYYFSPPPKFGGYIEDMRNNESQPNEKRQSDA